MVERLMASYDNDSLFRDERGEKKCDGLLTLGELAMAFTLLIHSKGMSREDVAKSAAENIRLIMVWTNKKHLDPIHPTRMTRRSDMELLSQDEFYGSEPIPRLSLDWRLTTSECDEWLSNYRGLSFAPSLDETFNVGIRNLTNPDRTVDSVQSGSGAVDTQRKCSDTTKHHHHETFTEEEQLSSEANKQQDASKEITRGTKKRWTDEERRELFECQKQNGTKKTAEIFKISTARVRKLLEPLRGKPIPSAHQPFPIKNKSK